MKRIILLGVRLGLRGVLLFAVVSALYAQSRTLRISGPVGDISLVAPGWIIRLGIDGTTGVHTKERNRDVEECLLNPFFTEHELR